MKDKKVIVMIIIIFILFTLGIIGFILTLNNNSSVSISCPVTKYMIVDGTKITKEMITIKKFDNSDNYICDENNIINKCVKKDTKIDQNSRIKESDLVNCEE